MHHALCVAEGPRCVLAVAQGDVRDIDRDGADGKLTVGYDPVSTARQALAATLYAVAKRDDRAIQSFVGGTRVSGVFGPPKNM